MHAKRDIASIGPRPGASFEIAAAHMHRRADGALVVGYDPSRLKICGGIAIAMAIIAGMWWQARFAGPGPGMLLALLGLLLAALFVLPSRIEIDRDIGVLRILSYRPGRIGRRFASIDDVAEVTLLEWQHPGAGGVVENHSEILIRLASGETVLLQEPRNAMGYVDAARMRETCEAIRREVARDAAGAQTGTGGEP